MYTRGADVSPLPPPALIAFKPRQVLLAEQLRRNRAEALQMPKNRRSSAQLKPEDESILTYAIALWLENKGFSKVLKRFLSAAQIQDDDWKAKALDLNEIFSKYQEISNGVQKDLNPETKKEKPGASVPELNGETNASVSEDIGNTKKKKKKKRNIEETASDPGRICEEKTMDGAIIKSNDNNNEEQKLKSSKEFNDEKVSDLAMDQSSKAQKDKKKKKSKSTSESLVDEKLVGAMPEAAADKNEDLLSKSCISENKLETVDETKDKKKKKKKRDCTLDNDKDYENVNAVKDEVNKSKKASKKRKRTADEDKENQHGNEDALEESKLKKSKGSDEKKEDMLPETNGNAHIKNKVENLSTNGSAKDDLSNNGVHQISRPNPLGKKQHSSEPKSVNAFQRVKIDEVEFVDERLQDNSYWAKDGAESGYGANAQKVFGQVKGRDFRHEKTKKKRGSYRGGQIDLQSHSIKFNYSDEE